MYGSARRAEPGTEPDGRGEGTHPSRRRAALRWGALIVLVACAALLVLRFLGARSADSAATSAPLAQPSGAATTFVIPDANATVVRVVDGDTVDVRIGRRKERVRLIGINTPETVDPRRPVECYGPQAKQATSELLTPGTAVRLERDIEARDDYGRLLGYIVRASDGLFVNLFLARQGFAVPLAIAPNTAHAAEFADAARAAEAAGRGLWGECPR